MCFFYKQPEKAVLLWNDIFSIPSSIPEAGFEGFVGSSLENSGNWQEEGSVVFQEVFLGKLHGFFLLILRSSLSDPSVYFSTSIKDKDIVGIQQRPLDTSSLSDFLELHLTRGIRQLEQSLFSGLLVFEIISSLFGRFDWSLSSEGGPEFSEILSSLFQNIDSGETLSLIGKGSAELSTLHLFLRSSFRSVPLEELETGIENKDISRIEGFVRQFHLCDSDLSSSLDMEQSGSVLLGFNVLESGIDTTVQKFDFVLKVRKEKIGFVSLNFSVLDGVSVQQVVQFNGLVSGGSGLILGSEFAQPKVDVPKELGGILLLIGVQNNVRITTVECSISILGDRLDGEFLNSPDLETEFLASVGPGFLGLSGGLADFLVQIRSNAGNIGIGQIVLLLLQHLWLAEGFAVGVIGDLGG
jgi:hypothetical protein